MTKQTRVTRAAVKTSKTSRTARAIQAANDEELSVALSPCAEKPIEAKTENQKRYLAAMSANILTFATGPAGTGKTFLCTAMAANMLQSNRVSKIILTRPAVEAGENLGFLPGEIDEKFDPYLQPYRDALEKRLSKTHVDYLIKRGRIEARPLAYMRGSNFDDAFVILDEAQNTTPSQMKMFLTRIGQNTKVVVNGDMDQSDIKGTSGLYDAVHRLKGMAGSAMVNFTIDDVVRSDIVGRIIRAYSKG